MLKSKILKHKLLHDADLDKAADNELLMQDVEHLDVTYPKRK